MLCNGSKFEINRALTVILSSVESPEFCPKVILPFNVDAPFTSKVPATVTLFGKPTIIVSPEIEVSI